LLYACIDHVISIIGQGLFSGFYCLPAGTLKLASVFTYCFTCAIGSVFTVLLPLIFALIVLLTRKIVLQDRNGWSYFPSRFSGVCLNFFVKIFPDGTAGSISYTQSNFLPVVQIARNRNFRDQFLVALFPSAIAVGSNFGLEE
jgi:hypothetical protein